jgi:hypothetical protein
VAEDEAGGRLRAWVKAMAQGLVLPCVRVIVARVCLPSGAVVLSNGCVFHVETVRLLLAWGADWNIAGEHGVTLLHLVCSKQGLFPLFRDMVRPGASFSDVGVRSKHCCKTWANQ